MFDGPERARSTGRQLGDTFIRAASRTRANPDSGLALAWGTAQVPYGPLPPPDELHRQRKELLDFQRRTEEGDPDTLRVLGYNFSSTMQMKYRRNLARPLLRWTEWALEVQEKGTALPESLPVPLQVIAVGDVGVVTIPCEAFFRDRETDPEAESLRHDHTRRLQQRISQLHRHQQGRGRRGIHVGRLPIHAPASVRPPRGRRHRNKSGRTLGDGQKRHGLIPELELPEDPFYSSST